MGTALIRALCVSPVVIAGCAMTIGGCPGHSSDPDPLVTADADASRADHVTTDGPIDTALDTDALRDSQPEAGGDESDIVVGPWDPVWHKTTPANWPEVPKGNRPGCGTHCRVIATSLPDEIPYRAPRASDRWVAIQGKPSGNYADPPCAIAVDLEAPGGPTEYVVDDGSWVPGGYAAGCGSVDGDLMLYVAGGNWTKYGCIGGC